MMVMQVGPWNWKIRSPLLERDDNSVNGVLEKNIPDLIDGRSVCDLPDTGAPELALRGQPMQKTETQAVRIIDRWPGATRPMRRQALARALGHPHEEKVRYWQKCGQVPQREWPSIIAASIKAKLQPPIEPEDFVRHLKDPAEAAATDAA